MLCNMYAELCGGNTVASVPWQIPSSVSLIGYNRNALLRYLAISHALLLQASNRAINIEPCGPDISAYYELLLPIFPRSCALATVAVALEAI